MYQRGTEGGRKARCRQPEEDRDWRTESQGLKGCWEDLASAVVAQAAREYRAALRILRRHPDDPEAEKRRKELEKFFRGRWFAQLTDLDGEEVMRRTKATVDLPRGARRGNPPRCAGGSLQESGRRRSSPKSHDEPEKGEIV